MPIPGNCWNEKKGKKIKHQTNPEIKEQNKKVIIKSQNFTKIEKHRYQNCQEEKKSCHKVENFLEKNKTMSLLHLCNTASKLV